MTVNDTSNRVNYLGNGRTSSFPTGFIFFDISNLQVYQNEVLLVLDTDYTVDGGDGDDGLITFVNTPARDDTITIRRIVPFEQDTDFGSLTPTTSAAATDRELDLIVLQNQQIRDGLIRAIKIPIGLPSVDTELPVPAAGKILKWNSSATALENSINEAGSEADLSGSSVASINAIRTDALSIYSQINANGVSTYHAAVTAANIADNANNNILDPIYQLPSFFNGVNPFNILKPGNDTIQYQFSNRKLFLDGDSATPATGSILVRESSEWGDGIAPTGSNQFLNILSGNVSWNALPDASLDTAGIIELSTDVEFKSTVLTPIAVTPSNIFNGLKFSAIEEIFLGTDINIGTVYTISHSLGRVPVIVKLWMECKNNDNGYVAGDIVSFNNFGAGGSNISGMSMTVSSTNVILITNSTSPVMRLNNKSTGINAQSLIGASGNWKVNSIKIWA